MIGNQYLEWEIKLMNKMNLEDNKILGIQPFSSLSSLTLARKTCPTGLLSVLSNPITCKSSIVYNEEVSGDIFEDDRIAFKDYNFAFLSANSGNIHRCVEMAYKFAEIGLKVIIGGPEPSMLGPRLLRDNPFFTAMVIGPGEGVMERLINDHNSDSLDLNIHFTDSFSDNSPFNFNPPFRSIDFKNAKVDYKLLWDFDRHEGLSYFWGNDCSQARKRCFFCGRLAMGVGYRPASTVWQELLYAYRSGIRFFYNTTDSVTTNTSRFIKFCQEKPQEMKEDIHRVFVNSRDVNNDIVQALRALNGVAVIGVESFGNFRQARKSKTDDSDNLYSIDLFHRSHINMVLSFVFGLPGETSDTLDKNEKGIIEMVSRYGESIDSIHISPLLITTGSPAFRKLMAVPMIRDKYNDLKVPFDIIEMSRDYFSIFCQISRDECIKRIYKVSKEVKKIAPHINIGAKGILNSESIHYEESNLILQNEISQILVPN